MRKIINESKENTIRIYLDQNIIDSIWKNRLDELNQIFLNEGKIIYSFPTLNEFSRINNEKDRDNYLSVLKDLNADYYWIDDNDIAHFVKDDPQKIYNEVIEENRRFKPLEKSMELLLHKMLGGQKGNSMFSIIQENRNSFNNLLEIINEESLKLQGDIKVNDLINQYVANAKTAFLSSTEKFLNEFNKNTKNDLEYDGINDLQKNFSLGALRLNNIKPPNIINQIWKIIERESKALNINVEYDDLFGDRIWEQFQNIKISLVSKINGLYNLLNSLGYHSDPQLYKSRKFNSFISDTQHSGHASYAHLLFSQDENFVKKTEAVYEHFNIGTKIYLIK